MKRFATRAGLAAAAERLLRMRQAPSRPPDADRLLDRAATLIASGEGAEVPGILERLEKPAPASDRRAP